MNRPSVTEQFLASRPWARSIWHAAPGDGPTFFWLILIHATAALGLILTPVPGWPIFAGAVLLTWLGGMGTTVCYHRALAHKSLKLHPVVRNLLTFFALTNGSGAPVFWTANHRLHHAKAETIEDVSSPRIAGFWWAHLRWLYQAGQVSVDRYCPDLNKREYTIWSRLQIPLVALSFIGGAAFGLTAFFWLGAIRLVFSLHAQCFVNSICHMRPGVAEGEDSSRNVAWLSFWHLFQGENWHRNHHAMPWSARLGWTVAQIDTGWWVIRALETVGLATDVRRPDLTHEAAVAILQPGRKAS